MKPLLQLTLLAHQLSNSKHYSKKALGKSRNGSAAEDSLSWDTAVSPVEMQFAGTLVTVLSSL